jgi:hypothetical protein
VQFGAHLGDERQELPAAVPEPGEERVGQVIRPPV